MEPEYVAIYAGLTRRHWWWRARSAVVLEHVAALAADRGRPLRILDVGCADGYLLPELARFGRAEGLEPTPGLGPAAGDVSIHPQSLESFAPAARFDLLLLLDVLEHLADPIAFLGHAARLLEPGGAVLITVPAGRLLWTTHDDLNLHLRRYDRQSLAAELAAAGFTATRHEYFFHALALAKLGQRGLERLGGGSRRLPGLPPAWLNTAAGACLRLERRLTRGLALPFGASLLAVARPAG
ncbi:MAG: class I SAM-dependent methyltransferase [Gammaproteobacteria bacterium]|nr:class I SAM-dependent methyltransferase [Gammaproteobacteria bacterium]